MGKNQQNSEIKGQKRPKNTMIPVGNTLENPTDSLAREKPGRLLNRASDNLII
jgi:hypothetical protein